MKIPVMLVDLLDRVGWTFAQSLAGSVVAAGTTTAALSQFDYRTALAAAGAAAVLALLKVIAVQAAPSVPAPAAGGDPATMQAVASAPVARSAAGVAALSATSPPAQ